MTWRDRLIARRDSLERREREDEESRREGFSSPVAKVCADAERPKREVELGEVRLICDLLADASECF